MAVNRNGGEGQTAGTTITTVNSGNFGDTAFSQVQGSGTAVYGNTHPADGLIGFELTPSGATAEYVQIPLPSSTNDAMVELCYYHDAVPGATQRLIAVMTSGGTLVGACHLNTAGKLIAVNNAGTTIATATSALVTTHTYRIRLQVSLGGTSTTGTILVTYFDGSQNTTAVQSNIGSSGAATAGTTQSTQVRVGNVTGAAIAKTVYVDSIQAADTTTPPGPYPATNFNGSSSVPETATVTADGILGTVATATLALAVGVTTAGFVGTSTGTSVNETATITGSGFVAESTGASVGLTDTIASTGVVGTSSGSSVPLVATVSASGVVGLSSGVSVPLTATITAAGTVAGSGLSQGASIGLTDTVTAAGAVGAQTGASVAETASLASAGVVGTQTAANLAETATVASAGRIGTQTGATLGQTANVTAAGQVGLSNASAVSLTVTIQAAGTVGGAIVPGVSVPARVILRAVDADVYERAWAAQVITRTQAADVVSRVVAAEVIIKEDS